MLHLVTERVFALCQHKVSSSWEFHVVGFGGHHWMGLKASRLVVIVRTTTRSLKLLIIRMLFDG